MAEDFIYQRQQNPLLSEDQIQLMAENDLLNDIKLRLSDVGLTMIDFGLDDPDLSLIEDVLHSDMEADEDAGTFYDESRPKLTADQERIFNIISSHIDNDTGGLYTIDAPGGSGKTFLCNVLLAYARKQDKIALATALSGIAATLMTKGTTFHQRFGAPCDCNDSSTSGIKLNSNDADVIRRSCIIFVDEVSMMSRHLLDFLDRFLQSVMCNRDPMGGKLVVLMHDFRQLLPVVPRGSRGDIISTTVLFSDVWQYFKSLKLTKNMLVELLRSDSDFEQSERLDQHSKWLLRVGEGNLDYVMPNSNVFGLPSNMACESLLDLETRVFGNLRLQYMDPVYLRDRAIMSCTNDIIQQCNQSIIDKLPGHPVICESTYRFENEDDNMQHDIGSLACVNPSGLPPHVLRLKVGCCIILIRNLSLQEGHCNGTRYIVLALTRRFIHAKKLNSMGDGNDEIFIPRIPMHSKESDFPVPFVRVQFPILVAYYLTISRAQGQTFKYAGLYLPKNVFAHGHMYVGLSRCGNPDGVHVFANQTEFSHLAHMLDSSTRYTKNVVYKELLSGRI